MYRQEDMLGSKRYDDSDGCYDQCLSDNAYDESTQEAWSSSEDTEQRTGMSTQELLDCLDEDTQPFDNPIGCEVVRLRSNIENKDQLNKNRNYNQELTPEEYLMWGESGTETATPDIDLQNQYKRDGMIALQYRGGLINGIEKQDVFMFNVSKFVESTTGSLENIVVIVYDEEGFAYDLERAPNLRDIVGSAKRFGEYLQVSAAQKRDRKRPIEDHIEYERNKKVKKSNTNNMVTQSYRKHKFYPIEKYAIQNDLQFFQCCSLPPFVYPTLDRARRDFYLDDCCDEGVLIDGPDLREVIEIGINSRTFQDNEREIMPNISNSNVEEFLNDSNNTTLTNSHQSITLYRDDETINTSLDLQAVSAIIGEKPVSDTEQKYSNTLTQDIEDQCSTVNGVSQLSDTEVFNSNPSASTCHPTSIVELNNSIIPPELPSQNTVDQDLANSNKIFLTNTDQTITLYRDDKTINTSLDLQAVSAVIGEKPVSDAELKFSDTLAQDVKDEDSTLNDTFQSSEREILDANSSESTCQSTSQPGLGNAIASPELPPLEGSFTNAREQDFADSSKTSVNNERPGSDTEILYSTYDSPSNYGQANTIAPPQKNGYRNTVDQVSHNSRASSAAIVTRNMVNEVNKFPSENATPLRMHISDFNNILAIAKSSFLEIIGMYHKVDQVFINKSYGEEDRQIVLNKIIEIIDSLVIRLSICRHLPFIDFDVDLWFDDILKSTDHAVSVNATLNFLNLFLVNCKSDYSSNPYLKKMFEHVMEKTNAVRPMGSKDMATLNNLNIQASRNMSVSVSNAKGNKEIEKKNTNNKQNPLDNNDGPPWYRPK